MKNYYKFKKQLTKWLTKDEIDEFTQNPRYNRRWSDKTFIIKSNGKKLNARYAVFVRQVKQKPDLPQKVDFINLLLRYLPLKEEGIFIMKTLSRYV